MSKGATRDTPRGRRLPQSRRFFDGALARSTPTNQGLTRLYCDRIPTAKVADEGMLEV